MRPCFVGLLVIALVVTFASSASAKPPPLGRYNCSGYSGSGQLKIRPDKHYRFNADAGFSDTKGEFKMTAPRRFRFTSGNFQSASPSDLGYKGKWGYAGAFNTPAINLFPIGPSGGWSSMFCEHA